jgi:putative ABC transport system permease protein
MFRFILREAVFSILLNKSRTILTLLGIVIGIASVITVVAAGDGGKLVIMDVFQGFSPTTLQILPNYRDMQQNSLFKMSLITNKDMVDFEKNIPEIRSVTPIKQARTIVRAGGVEKQLSVTGTTNSYIEFVDISLAQGRIITQEEADRQDKIAIVGAGIADEFFQGEDPIGQYIIAFDTPMQIVGVLSRKEKADTISIMDTSATYNNAIVVPVGVFRRLFGTDEGFQTVLAKSADIASIPEVRKKVIQILDRNHGKWDNKVSKYMVFSMDEQLALINQTVGTLTLGVALLAGISLLVSAIGIMNIMLVSVKERTREIGIRKALGAQEDWIMLQFLIETVLLCGGGGLIGLGFAYFASFLIGIIAHWPAIVRIETCVLAISLSVITGLFSGFYPASRAANFRPRKRSGTNKAFSNSQYGLEKQQPGHFDFAQ